MENILRIDVGAMGGLLQQPARLVVTPLCRLHLNSYVFDHLSSSQLNATYSRSTTCLTLHLF